MKKLKRLVLILGGIIGLLSLPAVVSAQGGGLTAHQEVFVLDSRSYANPGSESVSAFQAEIRVPGAPWLRVHFKDYNLGESSYVTLTSRKDGGRQQLDAKSLARWSNNSAYFNGDAVTVELHVAPGEQGIFFRVEEITVGEQVAPSAADLSIESQCGPSDNRVPSIDARVARLTFVDAFGSPGTACTAWLTSNGSLLTAGHCVDFDPDQLGPALPDGILDLDSNDVIEFNVPNSLASGLLVFANPNDQYPINLGSVNWNFDGEGQGLGKDFAVFDVFGNPASLKGPHQVQGFFRMTNGNPTSGNSTIRVTGYGTDGSPDLTRNQTQQTHTGLYTGESSSGANFWHTYQVDTTGGNSGSPIIWEDNGFTIGIHTNAGCINPVGSSANSGTSFEHNPLENALETFPGPNVVYADLVRFGTTKDGTIFHPYDTIAEATTAASSGAIISIVTGTYNEVSGSALIIGTGNKALTLDAPVGTVVIE